MSLRDTRDIGTAKIVMLGGGGGGGSYTAGNGINITNNVITNTRKGALTGVIDSVSSNIAHTQIDNALTTTTAGALVVLKAEASGTSIDTVRVQYGAQASESNDFRLRDTDGNYTTIDIASDDTIIMMLNATGYQMIVLSILGASAGGGYAGLGIGKKKTVTSNVIDTDIDLHRAPIVGDRLLVWFDEKVTNPTGLTTYNNGTAVTSNLESVTPLYYNAGWNILEFKNDGFLYNNCWVRMQNVPIPNNTLSGLSDTAISVNPTDGQVLTYNGTTGKWGNQNPSGGGVAESVVGTVESGTTASQPYAVGEHFIRNDAFCTAIAAIASGATLTQGTNYVEGTIAEAVTNKYNYSTTEHVVGKWIDGKTLYERTFEAGYLPNATYTFYSTGIPISSFPLTNIKRVFGIAVSSNDVLPLPFANGGPNSQAYDAGLAPANASGYFAFYMCCGIDRSSYKVYATVQYTKS